MNNGNASSSYGSVRRFSAGWRPYYNNDDGSGADNQMRNDGEQEAWSSSVGRDVPQRDGGAGGGMEQTGETLGVPRASVNEKTPARSFFHRSFVGQLEPGQYTQRGSHDQTAEIESLAESIQSEAVSLPDRFSDSTSSSTQRNVAYSFEPEKGSLRQRPHARPIEEEDEEDENENEEFEPHTRDEGSLVTRSGQSALTAMLRDSPSTSPPDGEDEEDEEGERTPTEYLFKVRSSQSATIPEDREADATEHTPLMRKLSSRSRRSLRYGGRRRSSDVERASVSKGFEPPAFSNAGASFAKRFEWRMLNPKTWDRETVWQKGVVQPGAALPAVFLGLLLNILDALSYGMILFPLGEPIFAQLGADGISMFYVSTIIAQLIYSCGGSIFKGGIGSEMIEVVPFFHRMALMILAKVGPDDTKAVFATTILAYALSSMLTGAVFFLMGASGLGSLIGFFPRHILIGCIGGVGWFLVATGVEVSARLTGSFEYDMETLQRLFQLDTVFLWTSPLLLAILFLVIKRFIKSNYLVGGYFLSIALVFYFFKLVLGLPLDMLREKGWVFDAPAASVPWYHFYTLYDFSAVNWSALADTVPSMFALTFFGILHVPINVPALGISTGEDHLNVDRELIAHGISNVLSGAAGSVQNYLVYTNSLLFIASGGNSRLAGVMLAIGTFGVLLAGPGIVGFIPIMVVGALIFMLGIELMEEALVDTWGKLQRLEYITVVLIVVIMGAWDFVTGIVAGIILACVNFVAQTSQKSAITATYSGQVAVSTVRRHPLHARFLHEAGKQTHVVKMAGFLFFGTIVSVEKQIRGLIQSEAQNRFLVLDLSHVKGLDFSAAEAFTRLNRIVRKKRVHMIICGVDLEGGVGKGLRNVGLFEEQNQVEVFEDLNSALEFCENELLKALHDRKDAAPTSYAPVLSRLAPPPHSSTTTPAADEAATFNSPRRHYLSQVAASTLREEAERSPYGGTHHAKSSTAKYPQPLPLLLLTLQGLTTQTPDFWAVACPYFTRAEYPSSSVLYREKEHPRNFYLLESGMLRAEYDTPQGRYFELIVAGRPCGELPFFGETRRTATVRAERDSVVWMLDKDGWGRLRATEPGVAMELMKVSLKLTAERIQSITSYVLTATR